jgi:hypothetical protein
MNDGLNECTAVYKETRKTYARLWYDISRQVLRWKAQEHARINNFMSRSDLVYAIADHEKAKVLYGIWKDQ